MKIVIIGAGAMGSMHGAYLSKSGEEVWLVDPWETHIKAINRGGLRLTEEEAEEIVWPKAVTND